MIRDLAVTPDELCIVQNILKANLPQGYKAFAFGSRVGGTIKPWSDLDVVIIGPASLSLSLLGELSDAFDESLLPWKVDVVDYLTVSDAFAKIIDDGKTPLS